MDRAIRGLAALLQGSGYLLIGWNSDRIEHPGKLESLTELFVPEAPTGLPAEMRFAEVTHVYAWFRRAT